VVFGAKEVFAAEELRTSVTSGQYRRLEQSFTAIDVRNAVFQWPYGHQSVDRAHFNEREHSKPWHRPRTRTQNGSVFISVLFFWCKFAVKK